MRSPLRSKASPLAHTAGPATAAVAGAAMLLACLAGCGPASIESVSIAGRLASGLAAHWSFDEPSGATTVTDRSGNGHDGQLTGGMLGSTGRFGGGLRLQPGDFVTILDFPQATADFTVSVWIKLSAVDVQALTGDRAVLLTNEKAGMGGWEIEFDPRPGFHYLEASYYVALTNAYVVLECRCIETEVDRWVQWTAVFDSTNKRFSLYHNGLLDVTSDMPAPILAGASTLDIGRWGGQTARPLSGVIDDYAIWWRALSAEEVAVLNVRAAPDSL